jgi:hypothetical protein
MNIAKQLDEIEALLLDVELQSTNLTEGVVTSGQQGKLRLQLDDLTALFSILAENLKEAERKGKHRSAFTTRYAKLWSRFEAVNHSTELQDETLQSIGRIKEAFDMSSNIIISSEDNVQLSSQSIEDFNRIVVEKTEKDRIYLRLGWSIIIITILIALVFVIAFLVNLLQQR